MTVIISVVINVHTDPYFKLECVNRVGYTMRSTQWWCIITVGNRDAIVFLMATFINAYIF